MEKRQSLVNPTFKTTNLLFDSFNGRKSINNNLDETYKFTEYGC